MNAASTKERSLEEDSLIVGETLNKVWLRTSAFLSLKSPLTRTTYSGILREWCQFLGAEAGTPASARKIVTATDLHAIAYRKFLESKPGEVPRMIRQATDQNPSRELERAHRSGASEIHRKKRGLEHTLSNASIHKKFAALQRIYRMLIASNLGFISS